MISNQRTYGIVLQVVAIVIGIFVGIQIFEWATGTTVSLGF